METKTTFACLFYKHVIILVISFLFLKSSFSQAPVNDLCANAILLTSGAGCTPTAGTVNNATYTAGVPSTCGGVQRYDVWYRFTAQSRNPTITLSVTGANFTGARVQVLAGICTGMIGGATTGANTWCSTAAGITTSALNLTIGDTYFIRVFSTTSVAPTTGGEFQICVTDPPVPSNDEPAGAINLTSTAGCALVTAGNAGNSTFTAGVGDDCSGTPRYDVWYTFTAQRVNPIFRFTATGGGIATPRVQVFSGIPGSFVSIGCGTNNYQPTNLVPGDVYYIRIYSTGGVTWPNTTTGTFNLCIEDPARPTNDDCAGSTLLTQGASGTCTNTGGNLANALPTAGVPGDCGNVNSPDQWYHFVATSPYPEVRVTGAGAALRDAGLRMQIFTGTCGALTSVTCNSSSVNNLSSGPTNAPFVVGETYYVRVYSNGSNPVNTLWNFNICVTTAVVPDIHWGKTYANITKGNGGGTIEPGDVLEIRAVLNMRSGTMFQASFTDNIPANTSYIPGTLRILTNEGKIFRQWTDAVDSDPAHITGSAVTINLGNGAGPSGGGSIRTSDRPTTGSQCIMVVSYRVQVSAVPFGTVLQMGGGAIDYLLPTGLPAIIAYSSLPATVYQNYGICTNTIGTNGILSEFGGTFGTGTTKDRVASNRVPANYTFANFGANAPGDYFYGVSNNTSPNNTTGYSINPNETDGARKVFGYWDVIGDHTGAADPLAGNLPADVNNGATGGYMVVINAAYRADTAFQDTVRNLCPNTSYEYSAWFRNICRKCGIDSTGTNNLGAAYIPTAPGDTSGVRPNLTFNINGSDYYSTGDILYTGQWIKKGFTYRTGPTETEMIINIRNNAPGGGGNDWAIDDIGVATCSPSLVLNPSTPTVNVCYGDGQSVSAEVISYYDNFTHFIWEKSLDSGTTWVTTGFAGNTAATFNGTEYQYTAVGPSFIGDSSTHMNLLRLRVASSADNLADINCSFRAIRTIQVFVNNCWFLLKTKMASVSGVLKNSYAVIDWATTSEEAGVEYTVEKSIDGSKYTTIATIKGRGREGFGERYQFTDPMSLKVPTYYRIRTTEKNQSEYSKVILLSPTSLQFDIKNVVNPFDSQVSFDVISPEDGQVRVLILDNFGRMIKSFNHAVYKGVTNVKLNDHGVIASGVYGLKVEYGNTAVIKRLVRVSK